MAAIYRNLSAEEQRLYCCLALQHKLGYAGFARLLGVFGTPGEVYRASEKDLVAAYPQLKIETIVSIRKGAKIEACERIVVACEAIGVNIAPRGTSEYPPPLESLVNPPPLLFIQGGWRSDARAVAVVGTRNPTDYGRRAAFVLARDLGAAGVTVVSGLAVGIDSEAHAGALEGGGRTLAVIGCGHDVDYPRENRKLRERILKNGAVISEFPPGELPQRVHFPRRNRILSALALGTVVVEAGIRSGALITAAYARAQGKALFAVPGPIFSSASIGANALLRRGFPPATSAEEILAGLETEAASSRKHALGSRDARKIPGSPLSGLFPADEDPALALWRGEETCSLDKLEARARGEGTPGGALAALLSSLLRLELRGLIQRLPGPAFRRMRCPRFAG